MKENIVQALKWYFVILFVVVGSCAFHQASQENDIKPVMIGVLAFGFVFIVFSFWKVFRGKVLMFTILTLIATAFIASYLPHILYTYADIALYVHFGLLWAGVLFIPGVPFMVMVIGKYTDEYD